MDLTVKRGANGYRIGDSHPRVDLTDHEVELMRAMHDAGAKPNQLARLFGVSRAHAWRLCTFRARRGGRGK